MNLVQLRKQAKELVRAARTGDPDALARLSNLPLKLVSAQLVLAREHGYPSWAALVRSLQSGSPDYRRLIENLATQGWQQALVELMDAGPDCTEALRGGLRHEDSAVRMRCCMVLDHYLDEAALPELIANLEHPNGRVRAWALHALACDRCKEGECRPGEQETIPIAMRLLREDRSRRVRTMAAGLLGPAAPRNARVAAALEQARDHDSHPVVRTVAGWYAPGGRNYEKFAAASIGRCSAQKEKARLRERDGLQVAGG